MTVSYDPVALCAIIYRPLYCNAQYKIKTGYNSEYLEAPRSHSQLPVISHLHMTWGLSWAGPLSPTSNSDECSLRHIQYSSVHIMNSMFPQGAVVSPKAGFCFCHQEEDNVSCVSMCEPGVTN
jgi:hypothetical protein